MGTTVVGFWRIPGSNRALVFHAGDSRLYRLRSGELRQLTRDHSLYQAWLDAGGHGQAPHRNIIVRALGTTADTDPDIRTVRPGRAAGGSDWIGLRRNEGYTVAGINQLPLLPGILVALVFLMAIGSAWWREGR